MNLLFMPGCKPSARRVRSDGKGAGPLDQWRRSSIAPNPTPAMKLAAAAAAIQRRTGEGLVTPEDAPALQERIVDLLSGMVDPQSGQLNSLTTHKGGILGIGGEKTTSGAAAR